MRKFRVGDMVRLNVTSPCKSHFQTGTRALLAYTYRQKYGGGKDNDHSWGVIHEDGYMSAWYDTNEFILLVPANDKQELKIHRLCEDDIGLRKRTVEKLFKC